MATDTQEGTVLDNEEIELIVRACSQMRMISLGGETRAAFEAVQVYSRLRDLFSDSSEVVLR